jgi:hypothetical protein
LVAIPDILIATNRATIIRSAANHRLPLISAFSFFNRDRQRILLDDAVQPQGAPSVDAAINAHSMKDPGANKDSSCSSRRH